MRPGTTMAPTGPLAGKIFHGAYTWAAWYLRFCAQQEKVRFQVEALRSQVEQLHASYLALAGKA